MEGLRELPSIEKMVRAVPASIRRDVRVRLAQQIIHKLKARIQSGESVPSRAQIERELEAELERLTKPSIRKVINATGVVLHTNLGRAPLGKKILAHMAQELDGYCSVEFDLTQGGRGKRGEKIHTLLALLTGAESALVVNNNAAAVMLALLEMARFKKVIVSRGELVQIGGGFRIPEILELSQATLLEVGTTNITLAKDYERALEDPEVAAILKVHPSNFVIRGHTEEVPLRILHDMAQHRSIPLLVDLGSGALQDLGVNEPTVQDTLRAGADLVCFSGDKLLGGPQAGILVGKRNWIEALGRSPFYRAIRPGKMELFMMEQVLFYYLHEEPLPYQLLLDHSMESLFHQAHQIQSQLHFEARVIEGTAPIGGGTTPGLALPTVLIEISCEDSHEFSKRLLKSDPPVVVRVDDGKIGIDMRTILEGEEAQLVSILNEMRAH